MSDWHLIDHDVITGRKKYMQIDRDSKVIHIRETMPVDAILEANKTEANDWQHTGGWGARKLGAVVAKVPLILDNAWKKAAGYDPTKSGAYDQNKYNSFLDDIDYRHIRTGGGKIGKQLAPVSVNKVKLKKLIAAAP